MTDEERAIELHDLALSVVRAIGKPARGDCSSMTECKIGGLTIRYWPKERWLDVICNGWVLTVERWAGVYESFATFQGAGKAR
jgi:hypothetical protein